MQNGSLKRPAFGGQPEMQRTKKQLHERPGSSEFQAEGHSRMLWEEESLCCARACVALRQERA